MTFEICPECDGTTEGSPLDGQLQYCTYCGYEFDADQFEHMNDEGDHVSDDTLAACYPSIEEIAESSGRDSGDIERILDETIFRDEGDSK